MTIAVFHRLRASAAAVLVCVATSACVGTDDPAGGSSHINGDVAISTNSPLGTASTVNGSIRIADHGAVRDAHSVNGDIHFGTLSTGESVHTVNGEISLGRQAHLSGDAVTVNGAVSLAEQAHIDGKISNVNGNIALEHAEVGADIDTVNGDITVGADSRVHGGLEVGVSHGWWHSSPSTRIPVITIGPHAVVEGSLNFQRQVDLEVSDSARIGEVLGAQVKHFSGATPQG